MESRGGRQGGSERERKAGGSSEQVLSKESPKVCLALVPLLAAAPHPFALAQGALIL